MPVESVEEGVLVRETPAQRQLLDVSPVWHVVRSAAESHQNERQTQLHAADSLW
jgi:hypothetical protein